MESVQRNSVPYGEQETHISFMRDEQTAKIYTTDSTQITRFDKMCKRSPKMWKCIADNGYGRTYLCQDKKLISARADKVTRELTEEQRQALAERFRNIREKQVAKE